MTFIDKVFIFTATGAGIGKIPFVPGTFGTLAGILFVLFFNVISPGYETLYVVALIIFAIWISDRAEKILEKKDPSCIVIAEIAGYVVTMAGVSISISTIVTGFMLFRFFDILKPFPIKFFERNFKGGPSIVLDDLIAGLFSALILRVFIKYNLIY